MKLRRHERREDATYKKAHKRLARLSTPEILDWCDQSGTALAGTLAGYRRGGADATLDDARTALLCLEAAVDILTGRQ